MPGGGREDGQGKEMGKAQVFSQEGEHMVFPPMGFRGVDGRGGPRGRSY